MRCAVCHQPAPTIIFFTDVAELDITSRDSIRRMVKKQYVIYQVIKENQFYKEGIFTISVRKVYVHGMTFAKEIVT